MIIDRDRLSIYQNPKLSIGSVVPHSTSWVSSVLVENSNSFVPFSFSTVLRRRPSMLSIKIEFPSYWRPRDVLTNVSESLLEAMPAVVHKERRK